jgi:hypothetical protein
MRYTILCVLPLLFLLFSEFLHAQDQWQVNRATDKSCEWLAPGKMKDGMKRIPTVLGEIPQITWVYQPEDNHPNYLYLVSWIDYPSGTFSLDSIHVIHQLFEVSANTLVNDLKGELVYGTAQYDHSKPSYVFRVSFREGNQVVKGKMLLHNDRFYMMQVYTLKDNSLNNDIDRFLQSIRML